MAKKLLVTTLIIANAFGPLAASAQEVVVKRGDTLSSILQRSRVVPLYGETGAVQLTVELNPKLAASYGNEIEVGDRLRLPPVNFAKAETREKVLSRVRKLASEGKPVAVALEEAGEQLPAPGAVRRPANGEFVNRSRLGAELGFEYFKHDATDKRTGANSSVLSNMSPSARLTWDLAWSPGWSSRMRFKIQQDKLLDDSASRRTLTNASSSRKSAEAGVIRHWSPQSRSSASLGFEERVFQYAPTATSLVMDYVGSGVVKLGHELDLIRARAALLGGGGEGKAILPASGQGYKTDFGYGGDVFFFLRHERETLSLQGTVFYGLAKESSNLVKQTESHLGASFGLIWNFE